MTTLRHLQTIRSKAGVSEDDARDIYARLGLPRSTRAMTDAQRTAAAKEIERLYPAVRERMKGVRRPLEGPFAKKLQALWIGAWNLGLVRNPDDKALIAFVERQTGIQHLNWLRDPVDAEKAIEALKKWMARDAEVNWSKVQPKFGTWEVLPGFCIARAQHRLLVLGGDPLANSDFAVEVFLASGHELPLMTAELWMPVMNEFGVRVRDLLAEKKQGAA